LESNSDVFRINRSFGAKAWMQSQSIACHDFFQAEPADDVLMVEVN
jgi:hypothetical protein